MFHFVLVDSTVSLLIDPSLSLCGLSLSLSLIFSLLSQERCASLVKERKAVQTIMELKVQVLVNEVAKAAQSLVQVKYILKYFFYHSTIRRILILNILTSMSLFQLNMRLKHNMREHIIKHTGQ
jgi:hypothetical protein